ncbi:MAG: hypothetical protein PHI97_31245 [Desulfobulbus sp.]|nr:hypothetical protein [Desulfobulbus sp.]
MKEISIENNFEDVWQRVSKETGTKSLRQLAVIIDKTQPTISAAKAKGEFPPGWAYRIGIRFELLTEWIMTGKGPKRIKDAAKYRKFEIFTQAEEWLNEEIKKNPKKEAWFEVEFEEHFDGFKKWKEEKEEEKTGKAYTSDRKVA